MIQWKKIIIDDTEQEKYQDNKINWFYFIIIIWYFFLFSFHCFIRWMLKCWNLLGSWLRNEKKNNNTIFTSEDDWLIGRSIGLGWNRKMFNGTVFEVNDFSEEKQKTKRKFNDFQSIVISRERVKKSKRKQNCRKRNYFFRCCCCCIFIHQTNKGKALEPKNSDDNVDTINTTYTNTEIKLTDEWMMEWIWWLESFFFFFCCWLIRWVLLL